MNSMNVAESSPLSPPPSSLPAHQLNGALKYRNARQLPFELVQHVQVYFEESMFTQGFRFLQSILSADASSSSPQSAVTVPSPAYLAVASTLSVHPSLTTRTTAREKWQQANAALRLLRFVLKVTGPLNAQLTQAFEFTKFNHDEDSNLNTYYANEGSLWSQAEDFWAVVGWSLNCSCLPGMYAARWEHWSVWLEFMLDVLDTDWQIHYDNDTCEESLLWQYIELAPGGNTRARRMLRAIFADGRSAASLNEFRPIFRRELKEPSSKAQLKKREVDVNVEAEIYGDYLMRDDSDSSSSENGTTAISGITTTTNNNTTTTTTAAAAAASANTSLRHSRRSRSRTRTPSRRATPKSSNQSLRTEYDPPSHSHTFSSPMGTPRSLTIRLRLLHLLSHIAGHPTLTAVSPTTFPSQDELYTLFVEFIKPLPLTVFQKIVSPSIHTTSTFSADAHTTLCEFLLQRTIEAAAPSVHTENYLTQEKLERDYLPFAASQVSIDANCRVSLLLEALLRRLNEAGCLEGRDGLMDAVAVGVQVRLSRVEGKVETMLKKKKNNAGDTSEDQVAWDWLVESGERMKLIASHVHVEGEGEKG